MLFDLRGSSLIMLDFQRIWGWDGEEIFNNRFRALPVGKRIYIYIYIYV